MNIISTLKKMIKKTTPQIPPPQATTEKKCSIEQSFFKKYLSDNYFYFSRLLGERLGTRRCFIDSDILILREAYDKANQKVQFEIDLHWRRTTHIWTLILALIVATGAIISLYLTSDADKRKFITSSMTIFSAICMIITTISISMLRVSAMWCKNWELHVIMLEPLFSGRLYQTHLGVGRRRLSMSKLNVAFLWVAFTCWIFLFQLSIFNTYSNLIQFFTATIIITMTMNISSLIIGFFISSVDKPVTAYELSQYGIKPIVIKNKKQIIEKHFKGISYIFIVFFIIMITILIGFYLFMYYVNDIEFSISDFLSFLNSNVNIDLNIPVFK